MRKLTGDEIDRLREQYLSEPLFCTFVEILDTISQKIGGLSSVEIWSEAKATMKLLQSSRRPDLRISGLFRDLPLRYGSDDAAALIMICVMYIISSDDSPDELLATCARKIAFVLNGTMLMEFVYMFQRKAEAEEEQSGNPVEVGRYLWSECHAETAKGSTDWTMDILPEGLRSCISDTTRFGDYCAKVNNEMLPYIQSPEGNSQMWKAVMIVSIEMGFISKRCTVKRFSDLLGTICPQAGESRLLDQNMQKYIPKENDLVAIRSRFV